MKEGGMEVRKEGRKEERNEKERERDRKERGNNSRGIHFYFLSQR